jgi:hypothetical protein
MEETGSALDKEAFPMRPPQKGIHDWTQLQTA